MVPYMHTATPTDSATTTTLPALPWLAHAPRCASCGEVAPAADLIDGGRCTACWGTAAAQAEADGHSTVGLPTVATLSGVLRALVEDYGVDERGERYAADALEAARDGRYADAVEILRHAAWHDPAFGGALGVATEIDETAVACDECENRFPPADLVGAGRGRGDVPGAGRRAGGRGPGGRPAGHHRRARAVGGECAGGARARHGRGDDGARPARHVLPAAGGGGRGGVLVTAPSHADLLLARVLLGMGWSGQMGAFTAVIGSAPFPQMPYSVACALYEMGRRTTTGAVALTRDGRDGELIRRNWGAASR